jgi:hypothetical protein
VKCLFKNILCGEEKMSYFKYAYSKISDLFMFGISCTLGVFVIGMIIFFCSLYPQEFFYDYSDELEDL